MSSGDRPQSSTSGRSGLQLGLIVAAIVVIVGGALMEGSLRVYGSINETFGNAVKEFDPLAIQIEGHGSHGYRQRAGGKFHYQHGVVASANSLNYRGPEVSERPDPSTTRIILLGGSTTHGYGVPDDRTIDAHMRALLRQRYPSRKFEVVNLAFDGYDAYQMLQRLESDGLRMQPDVVVLNEGINDVRNANYANLQPLDPRTLFWDAVVNRVTEQRDHGISAWARIKHYSWMARAPGYLKVTLAHRAENEMRNRAAAQKRVQENDNRDGTATAPGDSGPPFSAAKDAFDRNFRLMVDRATQQGAAVLLSTPPSALRWFPDTSTSQISYWVIDAKHTQTYRDSLAHRLRRIAAEYRAAGRPVDYVAPQIPKQDFFLDDCHLRPLGNEIVAESFVNAIIPLLERRDATALREEKVRSVQRSH